MFKHTCKLNFEECLNETEIRILSSLVVGCRRISEILKVAKVSKATFHRLTERMIDSGLVVKDVAIKEGYPPPVYYYITEKGMEELRKALKMKISLPNLKGKKLN